MRLVQTPSAGRSASIVWQECACPLCEGGRQTPLLEAGDPASGLRFLIVRCERCGLCFTNPRPDPVSVQQFYAADYPCHHRKDEPEHAAGLAWPLTELGVPGRLLDFGCGAGAFLRRMQAAGWDVTGLDSAEAAVAAVRAHGLPAQLGTLPHHHWSAPAFEAITMWQSLEHVHEPLEVVQAAHRLLTAGGRLVVAAPNFAGWGARHFGPHWFGLDVPRHLTHFTPATLYALLARAGFAGIDVRQERRNSWIRRSAQRAGGGLLTTRLVSGCAGWWGYLTGRAEGLIAVATKP
jgi:SAM-dependent methyltransferase